MAGKVESIVLGGGCFWCVEAAFRMVDGVVGTAPGYAGGTTAQPGYEEVCAGHTGHAEVVRVDFDPARVSLARLLEVVRGAKIPVMLIRPGTWEEAHVWAPNILADGGMTAKLINKERFASRPLEGKYS